MNPAYVLAEVGRTLRNTRYLVFAIGMPLLLFFVISTTDDGGTLDGLHQSAYTMVSMATFGAMSGVFSTGGRIGQERQSGWTRQLRLTSLTGRQYVVGKAVTGFAVALPSLVAVFVAAALAEGVHLSVAGWVETGGAILLALLPICALGIWLGYRARTDNLQAVSGGIFSLLALLGGVWVPLELFPDWVRETARDLPMAWVTQAGRDAVRGDWVGWHGAVVLAAWTVGLVLLAARAYDRDASRA